MEPTSFETLWGGTVVVPGMLVFADKKRRQIARLRGLVRGKKGKVTSLLLECANGTEVEIPLNQSAGPVAFDPQNLENRVPEPFRPLVTHVEPVRDLTLSLIMERFTQRRRRVGGQVAFSLDEQVLFNNERAVRELTGHLEIKCFGTIWMIDDSGVIYVSFIANPNTKNPVRWLLRCSVQELWVVTKRESLGTYGVRLHVAGVYGEAECDIQLEKPPSHLPV